MRKGQATRERILARAAELFNTKGYGGTVIADVMQAVDLEKGGIYRHFTSKDDLALAAFDYAVGIVQGRVLAATAGLTHSADILLAVVGVFRGYAGNPPLPGGCPILNTAIESDDAHPLLRERARAALGELQALLRQTTLRGIERGELRPEVDAEALAGLIIATLEGAVMMSRLHDDPRPLEWAANHLHEHITARIRLNRP